MSACPDWDPPFYWRRAWQGSTPMDEVTTFKREPDGTLNVLVGVPRADLGLEFEKAVETPDLAPVGLVIYGRAVIPDLDRDYVLAMKKRGQVFSECFSVQCPEGELGTHPLAAVTEITSEQFERARSRGWV